VARDRPSGSGEEESAARSAAMTKNDSRRVHLDIASRFDMLEMVQTVLGHVSGLLGFDEDEAHYVNVAVRESLVNAIRHGNAMDESKRVSVEFVMHPDRLEVRVQDQGAGFDPDSLADPTAAENILKSTGRGIFFMRSFMDDVRYSFPSQGGTLVTMVKKHA
jgi:serine/threonine-protein kinase RsbW